VLRVELGPRQWISLDQVQSEQANVGITLKIQAQDFDAVIWFKTQPRSVMELRSSLCEVRKLGRLLTCVLLQHFWSTCKLSTKRLIVFLVSNSAQEVETVELMEDLHSDPVPFFARSWVVDLQRGFWHAQFGQIKL
jgi:hypothetical protein